MIEAAEKAKELFEEFGKHADRVTEEIIMALHAHDRAPKYWYDVQEELNKLQEINKPKNNL